MNDGAVFRDTMFTLCLELNSFQLSTHCLTASCVKVYWKNYDALSQTGDDLVLQLLICVHYSDDATVLTVYELG